MRVYALTRDWNEFFAIQEDVSLRMNEIVKRSGTGFAFPSRTLYMGRDAGVDESLGASAEREVEGWRRAGELPFPTLSNERIAHLSDTLDYPPAGSTATDAATTEAHASAELLSTEAQDEEADQKQS